MITLNQTQKLKTEIVDDLLSEITPLEMEKVKNKMIVSARIEDYIKENKFSKSKFASEVNKGNSIVTRWLSGTQNLTIDVLTEIAYALNISISDLFIMPQKAKVYKGKITIDVPVLRPLYGCITIEKMKSLNSHQAQPIICINGLSMMANCYKD